MIVQLFLQVFLSLTILDLNKKNLGSKHKVNPTRHHATMKHIQRQVPPPKIGFAHHQMTQNPSVWEWICPSASCHAALLNFVLVVSTLLSLYALLILPSMKKLLLCFNFHVLIYNQLNLSHSFMLPHYTIIMLWFGSMVRNILP